jgi:hypothetical protein
MAPVCFGLASALMYLWLRFGFRLDDLIEWRSEAWAILLRAGTSKRASAFNDSGFVDGWFMCFRPTEHGIKRDSAIGSILVFLAVYPLLLAAGHAWIVYLLIAGARIYLGGHQQSFLIAFIVWTLPWLATVMIVGSHWQFRYDGDNPNWIQGVVLAIAFLVFCFLVLG